MRFLLVGVASCVLAVSGVQAQLRSTVSARILGASVYQCPADAQPAKCVFDVEVEPKGSAGCEVYFGASTIESYRRQDGNMNVLAWKLYTRTGNLKQYTFSAKGIDIKPAPGPDDFDQNGHDSSDHRSFKWRSVNHVKGQFRFEINVVRTLHGVSTTCAPFDPIIVNKD